MKAEIEYREFPPEKIRTKRIYENREEIDNIRTGSNLVSTPAKIKEACGEFPQYSPPPGRPHLYASYVFSLDGKIAFPELQDGTLISRANHRNPEGSLTDYWLLNVYRSYADAVILGGRTVNNEPDLLGAVYDKDLINIRKTELGKRSKQPVNILISRSGKSLPADHKIYHCPEFPTWIYTSHEALPILEEKLTVNFNQYSLAKGVERTELYDNREVVVLTASKEEMDNNPRQFLHFLKEAGIERVLIEPSSFVWFLMKRELIDELYINYSGIYVGGDISLGTGQAFDFHRVPTSKFINISISRDNFLYTRQKLVYGRG